ncbi:hypothetical protein [Tessaracoccus sp. OH4464_COT-324]|uniref:hypothetical protein n=1 Tax=Tessaracoccus sp. OH4464_COT-324 TaxID=2491059 RepID=UPI000F63CB22|nr:hypothetical protein [Tessaracoccus sp. OH4464_COT-324]RRD44261.1 hypothetical protein EII42_11990 [Tessaracoccus sp. OH4464_COT-324]
MPGGPDGGPGGPRAGLPKTGAPGPNDTSFKVDPEALRAMAKQWDQQSGVANSSQGSMPAPKKLGFVGRAFSWVNGLSTETTGLTHQAKGEFADVRDELLAEVKRYVANEDAAANYGKRIGG